LLNENELNELDELEKRLQNLSISEDKRRTLHQNREYFGTLRTVLHLYEDMVRRCSRDRKKPQGEKYERLRNLAARAIDQLGCQAEPDAFSLKDYDHILYGPFLGVSDEGSAASSIRDAALASPKLVASGYDDPLVVGVSCDGERMVAVGEVAVGPPEYRDIRLECVGRILTSTNVGTRLNLRYYRKRPTMRIRSGRVEESIEHAKRQAKSIIEPFLHTPDKLPRPVTLFASFRQRFPPKQQLRILRELARIFKTGEICDPKYHNLGLFVRVERGRKGLQKVKKYVELARKANLAEVAIKGVMRSAAEDKISMPGLLNYFNPKQTSEILRYASKRGIIVSPKNLVDTDTVARNVWTGLNVAKNMGLELGKYGLFPLTFSESEQIIERIQGWFPSWTAAPAFYVDLPAVDSTKAYTEKNLEAGIRAWLRIVSKHKVPIVLLDTADKDKGRRILKTQENDRIGILLREQIARIDSYANGLGVRILWAGGITVPQAFEMGKLGVFGIYVTSAAAVAKPVSDRYRRDVMLSREKEPTYHGVYRVRLLLEAGFLANRLKEYGLEDDANGLVRKVNAYLTALEEDFGEDRVKREQKELVSLLVEAWKSHFELCKSQRELG